MEARGGRLSTVALRWVYITAPALEEIHLVNEGLNYGLALWQSHVRLYLQS